MKTFNQIISEVAQPRPGDEKRFKGKHTIQQISDPENYKEGQFTSMKNKAERPADYKHHEDEMTYEGYVNVKGQEYKSSDDIDDIDDLSIGQKSLRPDPIVARPVKTATQIDDPGIRRQLALRRQMEIQKKIIESAEMTSSQTKKREDIVKGMKEKEADFKKRYGKRWKAVMYATANKMAMQEELEIEETAKNAYAVGMSSAMKSTGDKPPLKKSTIKKAHEIAKSIEKNEAVDWDPETKSDREVSHWNVVHKTSGKVVGKASTKKGARTSMDKHDTKHGSYAHKVVPVWKEENK